MTRALLSLPLVFLLAPAAAAQDMPLTHLLIDGEGWKRYDAPAPRYVGEKPLTRSSDGGSVYTWEPGERFLFAAPARPNNAGLARAPYAPLRLKVGEKTTTVTALNRDAEGRIYAATPAGIQVFDPTGRLCGVVAAPGGTVTILEFDGDRLLARVGDATYGRKLNTSGVK